MATSPPMAMLTVGDFAPWFTAPVLDGKPAWVFSSIGGVAALMFFYGSAAHPAVAPALARIMEHDRLFDDLRAKFFGITIDPSDAAQRRIRQILPGIRHFLDYDRHVSTLYGSCPAKGSGYRPQLLVIDHMLQIVGHFSPAEVDQALAALVEAQAAPRQDWAPVLTVPRVLEQEICAALIDEYDGHGGTPSGFMREVDGKTTIVTDAAFKMRRDAPIESAELRRRFAACIARRLVPAVQRSFQFTATRIERYIVAAYDAGAGHFAAHRDNTTKGTAHRRFAVTINLNDDYDGGDLRFPEFGTRTYRAPVGGAVVFSCSLLHEATPVTRGRRYATLPFLYDEESARLREANNRYLDENAVEAYAADGRR